jgi:hypothetical protein
MAQQYSARVYGKVYGTAAAATGFTVVADVFRFPDPALTWVIQHKFDTINFLVTLFNADNQQFFADAKATSSNEIVVNLTKAESGYVNAVFIA